MSRKNNRPPVGARWGPPGRARRDEHDRPTGSRADFPAEEGDLPLEGDLPALYAESAEAAVVEDPHAPDDALGLYLRQMGAIPLLSRDQELSLAKRLEISRSRY